MNNSSSSRADSIVAILRDGPATAQTLAHNLDCPEASVRRTIQVLRRRGYNITFALDGEYCMGKSYVPVVETGSYVTVA